MKTGKPSLVEFIRDTIRRRGPVTFEWFMEQALYYPELGYYSSGRCAIGRRGDYFTNVSVGALFGQLMAAQFAEIWERFGKIDNFTVVPEPTTWLAGALALGAIVYTGRRRFTRG